MAFIALIHRHRSLLWELLKREFGERYAGSALGWLWILAHQLFLVILYVIVFAYVFPSRVEVSAAMPRDYVTYILAGLVPWLAVAETVSRSPGIFVGNANLVKQVVFPIELLPVRAVLAALTSQVVALLLLLAWMWLRGQGIPATVLLLPVVLAMQLVLLSGICMFLGSLAVYLRDVKEFAQLFVTAGLFLLPVLYLPQWLEGRFGGAVLFLLHLNPFSYLVWCSQDALYFGRIEHPAAWVILPLLAIGALALGRLVFERLRVGFGEHL